MSDLSERQRVYTARWRKKNPDKYAAANRRGTALRVRAHRLLIDNHRDEYAALVADAADRGLAGDPRYRDAQRALRTAHPDEWLAALAAAKEQTQ